MKRTLLIFLLVFLAMQVIRPDRAVAIADKSLEIKAPDNIMTMFKTSCYDCHSSEVKWPWYSNIAPVSWVVSDNVTGGIKALNFSTWEEYTPEEKQKKLKAIYRTIYAAMPIPSYLWFHGEADLTKEQRNEIRDWTGVRKRP